MVNGAATRSLIELFALTDLGGGRFEGRCLDEPWPAIYGGQMLGQACAAAGRTVGADRPMHSMHAYFIKRGDPTRPLSFAVEPTNETRRFSLRRVIASQGDDKVLEMSASFHALESGWSHAAAMPEVASPEVLDPDRSRTFQSLQDLPAALGSPDDLMRAIDYRVAASAPGRGAARAVWLRVNAQLPDTPRLHEAVLAYMSDFSLIGPALTPHLGDPEWRGVVGCSLDHTIWIHDAFRCDDWLLYTQDSPWAARGRGLARGSLFDRRGLLVGNVAQEGLIRPG